jgi:Ca2+-binding EF-hand superfamily protein
VDYTEFIAAFLDNIVNSNDKYLESTFKKFDENGDGKISEGELARILYGDGSTDFNKEEID